jgi:chorismate-pyruvate lyase
VTTVALNSQARDAEQLLSDRHFVMQGERPRHLRPVPIGVLAPELRALLCTDGTVVRALEMHALCRAAVTVVAEDERPVPPEVAPCLSIAAGTAATMRRVLISTATWPEPAVCAESWIVYSRLPDGFSSLLGDSVQGIGQVLAEGHLESRRELLWWGLSAPPPWASRPLVSPTLVRTYRVMCGGRVAIVISEHFAIERAHGRYRWRTDTPKQDTQPS